jgi:hypothetical protein
LLHRWVRRSRSWGYQRVASQPPISLRLISHPLSLAALMFSVAATMVLHIGGILGLAL